MRRKKKKTSVYDKRIQTNANLVEKGIYRYLFWKEFMRKEYVRRGTPCILRKKKSVPLPF